MHVPYPSRNTSCGLVVDKSGECLCTFYLLLLAVHDEELGVKLFSMRLQHASSACTAGSSKQNAQGSLAISWLRAACVLPLLVLSVS